MARIGQALVLTAVLAVGGSPAGAEATAGEPLTVCFDAAADYSPVYPTREVPSTNREVKAVFRLKEGEKISKITSTWIAVDVGEAAPPNTEIARGDLHPGAERAGVLTFTLPRDLPLGAYRLDVAADEKPWASAGFRVVAPREIAPLESPSKLLPLAKGTRWTYAFSAEGAKGVTLSLSGTTPDAQGILRTTARYEVVGGDDVGTHLELRRGSELAAEEWWRLSETGLALAQRRAEGETTKPDPPRPAFPLPLAHSKTWTYEPKAGAKVEGRSWGPVSVQAPGGEKMGWVVFEREPVAFGGVSAVQTMERHWVPGTGFVREILVWAIHGKRAVRMESVLQAEK